MFIGWRDPGVPRREANTNGVQGAVDLRGRHRRQYRGRLRRIPQDSRKGAGGAEQMRARPGSI